MMPDPPSPSRPKTLAMIPARMGSQRLLRKNLQLLDGVPLITHAIRKVRDLKVFDAVWVNSEHGAFGSIATEEQVQFHQRPDELAGPDATSEQFVGEFLRSHNCDFVVQVHSIAPLLEPDEIRRFVGELSTDRWDVLLGVVDEPLEALHRGQPVNFSFDKKTNSQELEPVRRIAWSITGWRRDTFLAAQADGRCATYAGRRGFFPLRRWSGLAIKTADDLRLAEALYAVSRT